jgi:hypothetical protein
LRKQLQHNHAQRPEHHHHAEKSAQQRQRPLAAAPAPGGDIAQGIDRPGDHRQGAQRAESPGIRAQHQHDPRKPQQHRENAARPDPFAKERDRKQDHPQRRRKQARHHLRDRHQAQAAEIDHHRRPVQGRPPQHVQGPFRAQRRAGEPRHDDQQYQCHDRAQKVELPQAAGLRCQPHEVVDQPEQAHRPQRRDDGDAGPVDVGRHHAFARCATAASPGWSIEGCMGIVLSAPIG